MYFPSVPGLIVLGLIMHGICSAQAVNDQDSWTLSHGLDSLAAKYGIELAYDHGQTDKHLLVQLEFGRGFEADLSNLLKGTDLKYMAVDQVFVILPKSNSEAKATIRGQVLDSESGLALPLATIQLLKHPFAVISNNYGRFDLPMPDREGVWLVTNFLGYHSDTSFVDSSNLHDGIQIWMSPEIVVLEDLVVESKSRGMIQKIPGISQYSFNTDKMYSIPSIGEADAMRSLQLFPGISGTNETSSELIVRNASPHYSRIEFNGIPLYHKDHFFGAFSSINTISVDKIHLLKGGYSVGHGGNIGGLVQIWSHAEDVKKAKASFGVNMLSAHASLESPIGKRMSFNVSARQAFTNWYQSSLYDKLFKQHENSAGIMKLTYGTFVESVSASELPQLSYSDINGGFNYQINEDTQLSLTLLASSDETHGEVNVESSLYESHATTESKWGNTGAALLVNHQWTESFLSDVSLINSNYQNRNEQDRWYMFSLDDPSVDTLVQHEKNMLYKWIWKNGNSWHVNDSWRLDFGISYDYTHTEYQVDVDDYIYDKHHQVNHGLVAYIHAEQNLFSRLILTQGLRFNHNSLLKNLLLDYQLSASYQLQEALIIKASAARRSQTLNNAIVERIGQNRLIWIQAEADFLDPIYADELVLGGWFKKAGWVIDLETYLLLYQGNLGYPVPSSLIDQYGKTEFFQGEGCSYGFDLFAQYQAKNYNAWISYSFGKSIDSFDELDNSKSFPSIYDQRHEFKSYINLKLGSWEFTPSWIYGSGRPYSLPNNIYSVGLLGGGAAFIFDESKKNNKRLPPYHRLDLAIQYKKQFNASLFSCGLSLINIYNRSNLKSRSYRKAALSGDGVNQQYIIDQTSTYSVGFMPVVHVRMEF